MSNHTLAVVTACAAVVAAVGACGGPVATAIYAYFTIKLRG